VSALLRKSTAEILQCRQCRRIGISRLHIIAEACCCLREDYLYSDTGLDYRFFPSNMFEACPVQILTFSDEKTFRCLFLSYAVTYTRTDLRIGPLPSGVSNKRSFTGVDFVVVYLLILPCIDIQ